MASGGVAYAIRIRWDGTGKGPTLNNLAQRKWIRAGKPDWTFQIVPGWDPANDRNGDGYVRASE